MTETSEHRDEAARGSLSPTEGDGYGHYSMILEWDPRDNIYVVTMPELPGCQTQGETLEEAVGQGQDALESRIDVARKQGVPTPHPRYFGLAAVGAVEEAPPARTR